MEASITILIAVVVLFAFTLPTLLRRTERAHAQRALNEVPATAETCRPAAADFCAAAPARPELFTAEQAAADFAPPAGPAVTTASAQLSLHRPAPQLAVIDGGAAEATAPEASAGSVQEAAEDTVAYLDLPLAVGETLSLTHLRAAALDAAAPHARAVTRPMEPTGTVTTLDTQMTHTPQPGSAGSQRPRPAAVPAHLRRRLDAQSARPAARSAGSAAGGSHAAGTRRPAGPGAGHGTGHSAGRGSRGNSSHTGQRNGPGRPGQQIDAARAEQIAGTQSIIPMISVVFLGTLAGALITAVMAAFGALPWAVSLLAALLAVGSLLLIGSLNKRLAALRRGAPVPAYAPAAERREHAEQERDEPTAAPEADAARPAPRTRTSTRVAGSTAARTASSTSQPRRFPRHILDTEDVPAARQPAADHAGAAPELAETARKSAESAGAQTGDTAGEQAAVATDAPAEAPEAAPEVPVAGEPAAPSAAKRPEVEAEEAASTDSTAAELTGVSVTRTSSTSLSLSFGPKTIHAPAADLAENYADADSTDASGTAPETAGTAETSAAGGLDPFAQRLQATGWKPSPLPTPTYVDAPVAPRTAPEPVVADETSFMLKPQSKESLAAMFAAELGYRPEIEDAARDPHADAESGPLAHGRTAIRYRATGTEAAAPVASIDDVLARRRA